MDAVSPDGSSWKVLLRNRKMDETAKRGMGAAKELGFTVTWALMHPTAICRGIREEGESQWLCYVSRPSQAYDYRTGDCRRAWEGQVFLVFVDGDRIVYNWRWEKAAADAPELPEGYAARFEERVL
jgi:hypothetical protein